MDDLKIPCAYCDKCKDFGPVIVEEILKGSWLDPGTMYDGEDLIVVFCPGCMTVLNLSGGDVEVKWYDAEELPKVTGWRMSEPPE